MDRDSQLPCIDRLQDGNFGNLETDAPAVAEECHCCLMFGLGIFVDWALKDERMGRRRW